jgi:hypothetical protein
MANKNPFEIRADVLQLAKDYMDQQTQLNLKYWEKMVSVGKATIEDAEKAYKPYSMEELMKCILSSLQKNNNET